MAKKSFKNALNNPAMQFISMPEEEEQEIIEEVQEIEETPKKEDPAKTQSAKASQSTAAKAKTAPKPKTTKPAPSVSAQAVEKAPEGYKINPMYVEVKSKRVQLVLQPSLFEKVKALAEKNGDSVNNTIHAILEKATQEE